MQAPTTGNAAMDSAVAIISAIAIIAGIAAPYLKMRKETAQIGQMADTFAQKTAENTEEMYRALKAARSVVPELDEALKKYETPLSKIENRVETAAEQLEFFRNKTPGRTQASNVAELPRENFKVDLKKKTGSVDAV
jgi:hypothetical protein